MKDIIELLRERGFEDEPGPGVMVIPMQDDPDLPITICAGSMWGGTPGAPCPDKQIMLEAHFYDDTDNVLCITLPIYERHPDLFIVMLDQALAMAKAYLNHRKANG